MKLALLLFFNCVVTYVLSYSNTLYTMKSENVQVLNDMECGLTPQYKVTKQEKRPLIGQQQSETLDPLSEDNESMDLDGKDPIQKFHFIFYRYLFGPESRPDTQKRIKLAYNNASDYDTDYINEDPLAYYPDGQVLRAELFQNKSAVHLPPTEFMYPGHCHLKLTADYMQTAVNAFAIFVSGNLEDIYRLPREYILKSARTIAMMKIAKEKLAATWKIVKGDDNPEDIQYQVLEMYRPLFHHLNGREMARLNLSDRRILTFIGTHAGLNRHQVGIVASRYLQLNKLWMQPKYLNLMNNLLCGVPMNFMRKIPASTYLQLSHQTFYHIHACDPLQRRFYLEMMTKTQVLGKSYSWSARDVSRLGLLISEVSGPVLATIHPEAMSGIATKIMQAIPAENLKYITAMQLHYIGQKSTNILFKKLKMYQEQMNLENSANSTSPLSLLLMIILTTMILKN